MILNSDGNAKTRCMGRFNQKVWRSRWTVALLSASACLSVLTAGSMADEKTQRKAAGAGIEPLASTRVASGLAFSVFATYAPGDFSRLFILEKPGRIRILNLDTGVLNATPFLDINSLVGGGNSTNDERGLLGLAFHPEHQNNGFFYVNYTNNSSDTTIRRYTVSGNPDIADAGSAFPLLTIDQPFSNHNGGWIGFGPNDGFLYIGTGDGGSANDPGNRAQDITNQLLGKMLRIDVDGDDFPADPNRNYAIPPDNPFAGAAGDDEIWAYGLRNPWRPSFDRETGDFYIADVGQNSWEEIDFQRASSSGRQNYGWRCMEGNHCTGLSGCTCNSPSLTDPIHEYFHNQGCSITGGYVYRGCAVPSLQGTYFFADFCSAQIWSFTVVGGSVTNFTVRTAELSPSVEGFSVNQISSFGEDALGEVYIVDQGSGSSGQIFRIIPETFVGPDCNDNGVHDACDIAAGSSSDNDGDGVPDECACPADFDGDGDVDAADLANLLGAWGPCPQPCPPSCPADLGGNCAVGAFDLAILLGAWGPCP